MRQKAGIGLELRLHFTGFEVEEFDDVLFGSTTQQSQ